MNATSLDYRPATMSATFMALKPRPFENPELEKRFQAYFYGDGLAQMVFAISLMGIGAALIYLQYGFSDFEGTGWFEKNQLQRFYRIVVIAGFLTITLAFWNFWLKHWSYLAVVFVVIVYSVGILSLKIKMHSTGLPIDSAGGWRSVTTQISIILLTFPFIRISLLFLLVVAGSSTIALLLVSFTDTTQLLLAATGLLSAILSGAAIWINNYRRERDIFDRSVALEKAVAASRESEARATDLANRQRQLARAVTHDIRQPMAAVLLQMSLLKQTGSAGKQASKPPPNFEPLAFALDALQTQVQEIARDALPNRPADPIELTAVDIPQLVTMAYHLHAPLAAQNDISLRLFIGPRARHCLARTNSGQITTILQSLLSNAIKFRRRDAEFGTYAGYLPGIVIGLTVVRDTFIIRVFDNGMGIASEVLPRIFDEGFSTSDPENGSNGLGLFNVHRLTRSLPYHSVQVHSRPGHYTNVTLRLPMTDDDAKRPDFGGEQSTFARALHKIGDAEVSPLRGRSILLVEDDALVRVALQDLFAFWGARLVAVASASEALTLLETSRPDYELLVCDYHLGNGMNGLSVIRAALDLFPQRLGAILISGEIQIDMTGFDGVPLITKPIDPDILLATVQLQLGPA